MKVYHLILTVLIILKINLTFSQESMGFNFQTIIRDNEGKVYKNQIAKVKFSIFEDSPFGSIVYSELHEKTTNGYGVLDLVIGNGTTEIGTFENIEWGATFYFLKTEISLSDNDGYAISTTTQFNSVPYAMYSSASDTSKFSILADSVIRAPDNSPTNEIQIISSDSNKITLSKGGGEISINNGFKEFTSISSYDTSTTYVGCLIYCRELEENGFSDWGMAYVNQIEDYIISDKPLPESSWETWTRDILRSHSEQTVYYEVYGTHTLRFIMDSNNDGFVLLQNIYSTINFSNNSGGVKYRKCRCFR